LKIRKRDEIVPVLCKVADIFVCVFILLITVTFCKIGPGPEEQ